MCCSAGHCHSVHRGTFLFVSRLDCFRAEYGVSPFGILPVLVSFRSDSYHKLPVSTSLPGDRSSNWDRDTYAPQCSHTRCDLQPSSCAPMFNRETFHTATEMICMLCALLAADKKALVIRCCPVVDQYVQFTQAIKVDATCFVE